MTPDQFLKRCPDLWHVAPAGAWGLISVHGFRTAEQLINSSEIPRSAEAKLHAEPRRDAVRLPAPGGQAMLRDQGPLLARKDLTTILGDGLTTADWIHLLNRRVYLFPSHAPMRTLLEKYVALDGAQDVLTISPRRLLATARDRIELASQNTGAVARVKGVQKDRSTFVPLAAYPNLRPKEVTVVDGIDDLSVVLSVERHRSDGTIERLLP